jgi:hypothetical protein
LIKRFPYTFELYDSKSQYLGCDSITHKKYTINRTF